MFLAASAMTLLAVETVSCVSLYGATIDCAQEDCGGPPVIPGNNRAPDAEPPSNEADASDGARPSTDADASSDATTTSDADGSRDASGD
jgi:hypothetical protein